MRRYHFLLCFMLFGALASTETTAKENFFEQQIAKERQIIAQASICRERPHNDGELFARAMQDYWQREMSFLWRLDYILNGDYLNAQGRIDVTDKDCGLLRDGAGNPLHIDRNTCYPWKLMKYNTLGKLTERLKLVPKFGATRGFNRPETQKGGWIYDAIVSDLLHGKVQYPDKEQLYLPEDMGDYTDFAILHKAGHVIRWYGPDCCHLLNVSQKKDAVNVWTPLTEAQRQLAEQLKEEMKHRKETIKRAVITPRKLPPGMTLEDFRYLKITYRELDFNLDANKGGVYSFGKGQLNRYDQYFTEYFVISPCGTIICLPKSCK